MPRLNSTSLDNVPPLANNCGQSVNDLTPKQGTNWVPPFSLAYDNTDHGTLAWKDFTHNSTSLKAERLDSSGAPSSEARNLSAG